MNLWTALKTLNLFKTVHRTKEYMPIWFFEFKSIFLETVCLYCLIIMLLFCSSIICIPAIHFKQLHVSNKIHVSQPCCNCSQSASLILSACLDVLIYLKLFNATFPEKNLYSQVRQTDLLEEEILLF